jgi:hypothetical protein
VWGFFIAHTGLTIIGDAMARQEMTRILKIVVGLVFGVAAATVVWRVAFPEGIIYPTRWQRGVMTTASGAIEGRVYRTGYRPIVLVHFPDSPIAFKWFKVDFERRSVAILNAPRHIVGGVFRPRGIGGVGLLDQKIGEDWQVVVDGETALFSNKTISCRVGK